MKNFTKKPFSEKKSTGLGVLLFALVGLYGLLFAIPERLGDLDEDGEATILDVVRLIAHLNGTKPLEPSLLPYADVNQDGSINEGDADSIVEAVFQINQLPLPNFSPDLDGPVTSTSDETITISGSVVAAAEVKVVGGSGEEVTAVPGQDGSFSIEVPLLPNQRNRLFVTSINGEGRESPARTIDVLQDSQAPSLYVDFPANGAQLLNGEIVVTGRVGDMLSGFMGLDVTVQGEDAEVVVGVGQNGTYERTDVPLVMGSNEITIIARDVHGNEVTRSVTVERVTPVGKMITVVSGGSQMGTVDEVLPEPLVILAEDDNGNALPDENLSLRVTRSNGVLGFSEQEFESGGVQILPVVTGADGRATVYWKLGSDAGCGNNRLAISGTGFNAQAFVCASAQPGVPDQINLGSGTGQRAEVGSTTAEPLSVWVNDSCNPGIGIPVTFEVVAGDGLVNGQPSVVVNSDLTGHAEVSFQLGPVPGNNFIEASFDGNDGNKVTFVVAGVARSEGGETSYTGVVLDNSRSPIGNAEVEVEVAGKHFGPVSTGSDGIFMITGVDTFGPGHLHVAGFPANEVGGSPVPQGTYPALHFEVRVIEGVSNELGMPVLLPKLNLRNQKVYDGSQDVVLEVEGVEGLKMTIRAGSMRRKDGSRPSSLDPQTVSLNQVHHDDIPMPMPDGVAPPFAWTLQPGGATFDPPVAIEYPNMTGLAPGSVAYFLSYNHDLEEFSIVASGSVSADGSKIFTDPGTGITVSGWGCNCPPYAVTANCNNKNGGNLVRAFDEVSSPDMLAVSRMFSLGTDWSSGALPPAVESSRQLVDLLRSNDSRVVSQAGLMAVLSETVEEEPAWSPLQKASGSDSEPLKGAWKKIGSEMVSEGLNGSLRWGFSVASPDLYQFSFRVRSLAEPEGRKGEPYVLRTFVDGVFVQRSVVDISPDSGSADVNVRLPFLQPGSEHKVVVDWENVYRGRQIGIDQLVVSAPTASSSSEGVANRAEEKSSSIAWRRSVLAQRNRLYEVPATSWTSPFCVEGAARFHQLSSVNGREVVRSAGDDWYQNVDLNLGMPTAVEISFENGGIETTKEIVWTELDLVNAEGPREFTIRRGDSLLMSCGEAGGLVTIGASQMKITVGNPVAQVFDTAGDYEIVARSNDGRQGLVRVNVIGVDEVEEAPVVWRGRRREWTWSGLPEEAVIEFGGMAVEELFADESGRLLSMRRNEIDTDRSIAARLGENGPILASVPVKGFWARSVVDGFYRGEVTDEGDLLVTNSIFASDIPGDVEISINVFKSGVLLDDGSSTRRLSATDFDQYGEYQYQLWKPEEVYGSVCHEIVSWQGEGLIGRRE